MTFICVFSSCTPLAEHVGEASEPSFFQKRAQKRSRVAARAKRKSFESQGQASTFACLNAGPERSSETFDRRVLAHVVGQT